MKRHKSFDKGKFTEKWGRKAKGASFMKICQPATLRINILRFMNEEREDKYGESNFVLILVGDRVLFSHYFLFWFITLFYCQYVKEGCAHYRLFYQRADYYWCHYMGCNYQLDTDWKFPNF
jgi:hypothetical protein